MAHDIVQTATQVIFKKVVLKRAQDVQDVVRKSVFEFLLQLDANQVSVAFSNDYPEMMDMIFESLRDEDAAIGRMSLQIIYHLMNKTMGTATETQKLL